MKMDKIRDHIIGSGIIINHFFDLVVASPHKSTFAIIKINLHSLPQ